MIKKKLLPLFPVVYFGVYIVLKKILKLFLHELLNDWIYKIYNRKNPGLDAAIQLINANP